MYSSKIIKHKDKEKEKTGVRPFCLRQFPCPEDDAGPRRNNRRDPAHKKQADTDPRIRAQQEAHLLLESARREASRIQQQAFDQGFADGSREGRARAEAELASLIAALRDMHAGFAALKETFYEDHQDIILELALKIARTVIHQEIRSNNELVVQILTTAVRLAMDRERLKVRVHPDDLAVCLERRPDIMRAVDGIKQILFEPDDAIGKGGALIEYAFGEIDARIEQQFAEIECGLRAAHLTAQDAAAP